MCISKAPAGFDVSKLQVRGARQAAQSDDGSTHDGTDGGSAVSSASSERAAVLEAQIERLKTEVKALHVQYQELTRHVTANGVTQADVEAVKGENEQLGKQLADARLQITRLKAEVKRLYLEERRREGVEKQLRESLAERDFELSQSSK